MGADLLLAFAPWPTRDQTPLVGAEQLASIRPEIERRVEECDPEWRESAMFDFQSEAGEFTNAEVVDAVMEVLAGLDGYRRDVVLLGPPLLGRWYLITGGMSWGDSPTEAFRGADFLEQLGVTTEPFE